MAHFPLRAFLVFGLLAGSSAGLGAAASPLSASDVLAARITRLEAQVAADQAHLLQVQYRPPGTVPGGDNGYGSGGYNSGGYGGGGAAPGGYAGGGGGGSDVASLLVRVDRLENKVRDLYGQIEQLQYNQKKLEDELRKFQQDVDFRFQDLKGGPRKGRPIPQKRGDIDTGTDVASAAPGAPMVIDSPADVPDTGARHRDDAFNPATDPDAPGAPRPLGTLAASGAAGRPLPGGPLGDNGNPNAPMDLTSPGLNNAPVAAAPAEPRLNPLGARPIGVAPPDAQVATVAPPAGGAVRGAGVGSTVFAGLPPADTSKTDFDLALVSLNNSQYGAAEKGFRAFIAKYPHDHLVPEATYYLGQSLWRRGHAREAAEQFLKVSTDYAKSARAPDALLNLGLALEKLGAKEQACATWGEVGRKYPRAPVSVRAAAQREAKRLAC